MYKNDFDLSFPLQKIDKSKRIVTGIATANNLDLGGDIIDFEASVEAFNSWVGNVREMHDSKIAAGKLVDWRPTKVFHNGIMYDAIEVDVYISKGAESTWQKIIDGTLKGFSIGGRTLEKEKRFDQESSSYVNYITKYMLNELSVVDNPCNPVGMFMLIKMADNGQLEIVKENTAVYYCSAHKYATIDDNKFCPSCSLEMETIGFVEEFNAEVISKVISDFELTKKGNEIMNLHKNEEGDTISPIMNDLTDSQKASVASKLANLLFGSEEVVEKSAPTVVVNIDKTLFEKEEVVVEKVEEETVEPKIEKSAEQDSIVISDKEESMELEEILKGVASLLDEKLEAVKTEISADVDAKVSAIEKSVSDFKDEATESLEKANEEIAKVANTGAIQKSVVIEEENVELIEKSQPESFWGGVFVDPEIAKALGYES